MAARLGTWGRLDLPVSIGNVGGTFTSGGAWRFMVRAFATSDGSVGKLIVQRVRQRVDRCSGSHSRRLGVTIRTLQRDMLTGVMNGSVGTKCAIRWLSKLTKKADDLVQFAALAGAEWDVVRVRRRLAVKTTHKQG
ncbi:unnamed protein product [Prorocentrum cordatum]|uniref:Uncharacterized protein n=1 Tax=Prorocentrum cordatum TaxID=2364126 RepID=A0ABN9TP82_9DINO|nr:unnamed protein product [Polarella glacialis]|mmetsp:Transcript_27563/g.73501  ORF Transcript_27563/g.73501 Transcript_27563/m.73501 type:complete len:136 (+) Transcript_27563:950-1357(+)